MCPQAVSGLPLSDTVIQMQFTGVKLWQGWQTQWQPNIRKCDIGSYNWKSTHSLFIHFCLALLIDESVAKRHQLINLASVLGGATGQKAQQQTTNKASYASCQHIHHDHCVVTISSVSFQWHALTVCSPFSLLATGSLFAHHSWPLLLWNIASLSLHVTVTVWQHHSVSQKVTNRQHISMSGY